MLKARVIFKDGNVGTLANIESIYIESDNDEEIEIKSEGNGIRMEENNVRKDDRGINSKK